MAAQGDMPESGRRSPAESEDEPTAGTPRWVIVSGIVVLVLIVVFVAFHLAGVGFMGHLPPISGK